MRWCSGPGRVTGSRSPSVAQLQQPPLAAGTRFPRGGGEGPGSRALRCPVGEEGPGPSRQGLGWAAAAEGEAGRR